jgi:hypothetical protein
MAPTACRPPACPPQRLATLRGSPEGRREAAFAPESLREEYMALILLPVAFVLGLVIRDVRRASVACLLVWVAALVGLLVAKLGGVGVSRGKRWPSPSASHRRFCLRGSRFV